jgi:hypothetical protein
MWKEEIVVNLTDYSGIYLNGLQTSEQLVPPPRLNQLLVYKSEKLPF